MIKIELTEEEAEVISNYIFRKVCRLEDAKLEESAVLKLEKYISLHYMLLGWFTATLIDA